MNNEPPHPGEARGDSQEVRGADEQALVKQFQELVERGNYEITASTDTTKITHADGKVEEHSGSVIKATPLALEKAADQLSKKENRPVAFLKKHLPWLATLVSRPFQ